MNYESFLKFKSEILKERSDLINLAENNLYKYHPSKLIYDNTGHVSSVVYRCHLVEDWLNYYSLPESYKKYIGVSNGIRHSLEVLSDRFKDKVYLIPQDVYPFYQKMLNEKSITYKEYETLNNSQLLFSDIEHIDADILVITDPIKPLGRDVVNSEYDYIESWLLKNKERVLLVDSAYMLDNKINQKLLELHNKTGQVILMYSLSKGWSLPNCLGITIFMKNELGVSLRESYKILDKNQDNLNLAYMALNKGQNTPVELKQLIEENQKKVESYLGRGLPVSKDNPSYLHYLDDDFHHLLEQNILSIPATVFGGKNGVVISTLV